MVLLALCACQKEQPHTVLAPVSDQPQDNVTITSVAQNITISDAPKPLTCSLTLQKVIDTCELPSDLKQVVNGTSCVFTLRRSKGQYLEGSIVVEISPADFESYNVTVMASPGRVITNELKPHSAYNELSPYKYYWWFDGERVIHVRADKELCKLDQVKQLVIEAAK